jgi:hypothetical protein
MIHTNGLHKTKRDPRDYDLVKTFGSTTVLSLPDYYFSAKPLVKNQYNSDFCTAFACSAVAEDQDGVEFSPEWFFAQEQALNPTMYGQDLRTAVKTATKVGFLPKKLAPFSLADESPDFLRISSNWADYSVVSKLYLKKGYFNVQRYGTYDIFDSIRIALWLNRNAHRSILTGANWYGSWSNAEGGVIPEKYDTNFGTLHAFKIFGWRQIDGESYLMIQNSEGVEKGFEGIFYMSRKVACDELTEPLFMLIDLDEDTKPVPVGNWFEILLFKLKQLFYA